jgi:hypothetical protein
MKLAENGSLVLTAHVAFEYIPGMGYNGGLYFTVAFMRARRRYTCSVQLYMSMASRKRKQPVKVMLAISRA